MANIVDDIRRKRIAFLRDRGHEPNELRLNHDHLTALTAEASTWLRKPAPIDGHVDTFDGMTVVVDDRPDIEVAD